MRAIEVNPGGEKGRKRKEKKSNRERKRERERGEEKVKDKRRRVQVNINKVVYTPSRRKSIKTLTANRRTDQPT